MEDGHEKCLFDGTGITSRRRSQGDSRPRLLWMLRNHRPASEGARPYLLLAGAVKKSGLGHFLSASALKEPLDSSLIARNGLLLAPKQAQRWNVVGEAVS